MFSEGVSGDIQYRVDHAQCGQKTMHSTGEPVFEHDKVARLIGNTLDITERANTARQLRRREAYREEAEALSHTGSFGWNLSTGELIWSDETFRILGYESTVNPTLDFVFKRVHPDDLLLVQRVIENAKAGESLDFEHRLLLSDGSVKHVHVIAHPLTKESSVEPVVKITGFEPARTSSDWLSRDNAEVDAFINDPVCFPSLKPKSMESFLDAFPRLAAPREILKVRDDLPIYIFSGSEDPVGQRLEGLRVLIDRYRSAGLTSIAQDFYSGGRHEMLHEINRRDVITNLLVWMSSIVERRS